jgi:hypothetical protein
MLADSKQEKLPAQKKNDGEDYPAPAELAAAPATNLNNAGSFAPVQRKIELHDRDEGTYSETEKEKAASDAGDLFFTGGYHKTLPVFLNANVVNFVIKFVEEAMGIDEKTEDETYYKELDKGIKTLSGGVAEALGSAVFYTDDAVVTKEISFPAHWLTQALRKPLLRDPLAKRGGFMNRFQSAFGTLFTPRSKDRRGPGRTARKSAIPEGRQCHNCFYLFRTRQQTSDLRSLYVREKCSGRRSQPGRRLGIYSEKCREHTGP